MVPLITDRKQASFHFAFPSPLHPLNANILYPSVLATRTHLVEIYMPIAKKETPEELPQGMHSILPLGVARILFHEGPGEKKSIRK